MGWLDVQPDKRRQHLQMIATGNIRDVDRIHERNRRRGINTFLWILFVIGTISGFLIFKADFVKNSFYFFGFSVLILIILIFRYGLHKKIKLKAGRSKNNWQRIDRLPNWAHRKMKRKHRNIINGEHYVYKREGNKFYKKSI